MEKQETDGPDSAIEDPRSEEEQMRGILSGMTSLERLDEQKAVELSNIYQKAIEIRLKELGCDENSLPDEWDLEMVNSDNPNIIIEHWILRNKQLLGRMVVEVVDNVLKVHWYEETQSLEEEK